MKKSLFIWFAVFVGLVIIGVVLSLNLALKKNQAVPEKNSQVKTSQNDGSTAKEPTPAPVSASAADPKNATYIINGEAVTLKNGSFESEPLAGSAIYTITSYFGNEAQGDLNNDGQDDLAFLVTQDNGGSGIFYYLTGMLSGSAGYQTLNTVLIGDRISPQTTEIKDGKVIVNYADRKTGEPMSAEPSAGISKYFQIVNNQIVPAEESSNSNINSAETVVTKKPDTANVQNSLGMANPASENCLKLGGNLVTKNRGDGGQYSICYFDNNQACEEWALMRNDCPIGGVTVSGISEIDQKYCAWSGGQILAGADPVCVLKNGTRCSIKDFFNGICPRS